MRTSELPTSTIVCRALSQYGVMITGGAARSGLFVRIIIDVLGLPVVVSDSGDAPCVGAAILAGMGIGFFNDATDAISRLPVGRTYSPDEKNMCLYESIYEEYKIMTDALRRIYQKKDKGTD